MTLLGLQNKSAFVRVIAELCSTQRYFFACTMASLNCDRWCGIYPESSLHILTCVANRGDQVRTFRTTLLKARPNVVVSEINQVIVTLEQGEVQGGNPTTEHLTIPPTPQGAFRNPWKRLEPSKAPWYKNILELKKKSNVHFFSTVCTKELSPLAAKSKNSHVAKIYLNSTSCDFQYKTPKIRQLC